MPRIYRERTLQNLIDSGEVTVSGQKINPIKAKSMILEGNLSQTEIGFELGVCRQRVNQFIFERNLQDEYRRARKDYLSQKRKDKIKESEDEFKRLEVIAGIISSLLTLKYNSASKNEDLWPELKAFEYRFSLQLKNHPRVYTYERLTNLFSAYKDARDNGVKKSLEDLEELSGILYPQIGRILKSIGEKPMYGFRKRSSPLSESEKSKIQLAYNLGISKTDIAFFERISYQRVQQYLSKNGVKSWRTNYVKVIGKKDARGGSHFLTYKLASLIYESFYEGLSVDETAFVLNTSTDIVDYARRHWRDIQPQINCALKLFYPERTKNLPFITNEDLNGRKR